MLLEGKTAVITGCNRGIGLSILKKFSENNCNIIACNKTNNNEEFITVCDELKKKHNIFIKNIQLDLSNHEQVKDVTNTILLKEENIDILVNNAGITGPTAPLWEYDLEMWKKVVEINLMGTFHCCKAIVPNMIKNNYGRIVNVASVAGKDGNANASAYSVGKAGAIGLTKSLGKELADKNIAVNAVTPAGAKTRILDQMTKEHVQRMLSKVPRGRFLEVEEFTSLICWLSSEENTFSTAAVFDISGGRSTY